MLCEEISMGNQSVNDRHCECEFIESIIKGNRCPFLDASIVRVVMDKMEKKSRNCCDEDLIDVLRGYTIRSYELFIWSKKRGVYEEIV